MTLPDYISYRYHRIDEIDLGQADSILSEDEQAYLASVSHAKRQVEFTAGRIVARQQAASLLHTSPHQVQLTIADDGALELNGTPFSISLAHSREGVCTAMAEQTPVGIDLETIRPRHPDLHRFILSPDEYPLLDNLPLKKEHILILCWVLKEATLKGMRTGFRCSPKELHLDIDIETETARVSGPEKQIWNAHYTIHDRSYLALAYPDEASRRGVAMMGDILSGSGIPKPKTRTDVPAGRLQNPDP